MLDVIHLIRHGEVLNPDHVVYADLDGFGLSPVGVAQAAAVAARLSETPVTVLTSSPLQRAIETATPLASALGLPIDLDERLTEWRLGRRWAGTRWEDLPDRFPGELEAYLSTPTALDFAPEQIVDVAVRVREVIDALGDRHPGGCAALISHQDPVQAIRLVLTGREMSTLHEDKPGHASIITLRHSAPGWIETSFWSPEEASEPFPPVNGTEAT